MSAKETHSLLSLFVESAWEKDQITNLREWLTSAGANFNVPNWYLLWRCNIHHKKVTSASEKDVFMDQIASELRNILPILFNSKDNINYTDDNGRTLLHAYLADDKKYCLLDQSVKAPKDLKVVKFLLDKGASINAVDKRGKTPLHLATTNKNLVLIEPILNLVDNYIDVCDEKGDSVLHKVVYQNYMDDGTYRGIFRALLSKGADPNKKNKTGMTAVKYAVIHCNIKSLQVFKDYGASFNVHTDDDDNLLHHVYKDGVYVEEPRRIETIIFLLQQVADVNIKNSKGYSFVHLVVKRHFDITPVQGQCPERMFQLQRASLQFIWNDKSVRTKRFKRDVMPEQVQVFINQSSGVNTKMYQRTSLQSTNNEESAIRTKRFKTIASTLANAGADWDAFDCEGVTPLHRALKANDSNILSIILMNGANINDRRIRELLKNCDVDSRNAIINRAVELKTLGFAIDKVYQSPIHKRKDLRERQEVCSKEVDALKILTISDGISMYDFIHLNWKRQLALAHCVPQDLQEKFPIYYGTIRNVCNEAKRRSQLLESAKLAWYKFTKIYIPDTCVEGILDFLNNCNLNLLIHVSETTTRSKSLIV